MFAIVYRPHAVFLFVIGTLLDLYGFLCSVVAKHANLLKSLSSAKMKGSAVKYLTRFVVQARLCGQASGLLL